jgi:adenylate kinase family enzyme
MKRVLVIGSGGSGKSTFARRLGEQALHSSAEAESFLEAVRSKSPAGKGGN